LTQGSDLDVVGDRHRVPAEADRPAAEALGQALVEGPLELLGALSLDKDLEPRPPAVIGRTKVIEAEDVRAPAEQGRRMTSVPEQRCNSLVVEGSGQLEAGNELAQGRDPRALRGAA
jgi:hypothetical protein